MDFLAIEKKWQQEWEKAKIFEPTISKNKKKFYFTIPFPYTNGAPHIGHGRTFITGDFIARFYRKLGYNVLWPEGFHRTGTPILAISYRIKNGDKDYISLYKKYIEYHDPDKVDEIIKSFEDPENVANYFAKVIETDFKSIGCSIDWSRKFCTGTPIFNKFVEWQYQKLMEHKVIKKGKYPITYCLNCQNAVGEDDIKDADVNKVEVNEFTAIKFKLGDKYVVAATLRPETIFGITNIWVNPDAVYVEAEVSGDRLIISKEAFEKLTYQRTGVKKINEFLGKELVGKFVEAPIGKEVIILPSSFVDPDIATGVVYSVPAHAPFDYVALKEIQSNDDEIKKYGLNVKYVKSIKPYKIINIKKYKGLPAEEIIKEEKITSLREADKIEEATKIIYKDEYYEGVLNDKCDKFAGVKVSEAKEKVVEFLGDKAFVFYETSRKAVCRCTGKVIVAVLRDQWFLDYSSKKWKEKTRKLINKLEIIPEVYRKTFLDVLDWLDKRPCARKRGIGTPLPFDKNWIIESLSDSTIYMAFYLISHIIKRENIKPEQLTYDVFEYVFNGKGNPKTIDKKILDEMRNEFLYWYPNDHRHTAPAHISNHLIFFLMHHTLLFPEKFWPKKLSFNGLVIREGAKMSKSKGNVIPLVDISRKYGVDLFRLFVLSSSNLNSVFDWRESALANIRNKLENFANMIFASLDYEELKNLTYLDKWILNKFYQRINEAKNLAKELKVREYCVNVFFELINDLNLYKKLVPIEKFNKLLRKILPQWMIVLEPIIPHFSEEVWHRVGNNSFVSLELYPKAGKINREILAADKLLQNLHKDINEVLSLVKFKPKKITLFVADEWKYELYKTILKTKDKKSLISEAIKNKKIKEHGKEAVQLINFMIKKNSFPDSVSTQEIEYSILNEIIPSLESEYECEFDVVKNSNHEKSKKALPGKPGILVE